MSALLPEEFISVTPTLIRVFGAPQAIILQHIHHRSLVNFRGEKGETRMSQAEISEDTGLSESTVYRGLKALLADGVISIKQDARVRSDGTCDRTRTYEIDHSKIPEVGAKASDREKAPKSSDRESQVAESRNGSSIGEEASVRKTSPTPPEEGEQPELFAGADRGAATRNEKLRRSAGADITGVFEPLWKLYPSEGGKGKGSKQAAVRAARKALKAGLTSGDLRERIEHYNAARQAYEDSWHKPAPLMNASTFFNGKHEMFDHPWDSDDLTYWPAPKGRDWQRGRRQSVAELLAAGGDG